MRRVGIVSYNMYGNFTNYGSALQTYALHKTINRLQPNKIESIVLDYCPDILQDKDILNPMGNMWDTDEESRECCRLSLPAIRVNYDKFKRFFKSKYSLSSNSYTSLNFNESYITENLDGYICGSDTIFAVPEFGFDDGFYANYDVMKGRSVAYAASFGDYEIKTEEMTEVGKRLNNFNYIALRENDKVPVVKSLTDKPVAKVLDPTLLLTPADYNEILQEPDMREPYLFLYARRRNQRMQEFAERIAEEKGWKIVEISLNAKNADRHIMRYDAGVEEFLGLIKKAEMVVTNSFHGMIFAIQFKRPFYVFSRKLCDTKIIELLDFLNLSARLIHASTNIQCNSIDYEEVHEILSQERAKSIQILRTELLLD